MQKNMRGDKQPSLTDWVLGILFAAATGAGLAAVYLERIGELL